MVIPWFQTLSSVSALFEYFIHPCVFFDHLIALEKNNLTIFVEEKSKELRR
jgi:hypothetical protein